MEKAEFWEKLIVLGLNALVNKSESITKEIYTNHIDILESRLHKVDNSIQMKIVEDMWRKDPQLLKEKFWVEYVEKSLKNFEDVADQYVYENGNWFVLLNRIKDTNAKVDWFEVLVKLSKVTAELGSKAPGFLTVLNWLIMADKQSLLSLLHRTETKQYPQDLKADLYKRLIEFGMLDIKIARRIRSDSSGTLSHKVLAALFENRNMYEDDIFQNLITQFSDTKHKWVARYIALNMPVHLIPFLMGLEDTVAMQILEKRLNSTED